MFVDVDSESAGARRTMGTCRLPGCTDPTTVALGGDDGDGRFSIVSDNEGAVVVAWFDTTTADLVVVRCTDNFCTGAEPVVISSDLVSDAFAIAVSANNDLTVAYVDSNGLQLMRCADPTCTGDQPVALPTGPGTYLNLSMVINEQGNPVLIAEQWGSGAFDQLFVCTNPDCHDAEPTELVESGGYDHVIVKMKPDGTPTIMMLGGQIYVMSCTTPTCSNDQPQRVDVGTLLPWTISAVLDETGHPVIAYTVDGPNSGELWILVCKTPTCVGDQPMLVHRGPANSDLYRPSIDTTSAGHTIITVFERGPDGLNLLLVECPSTACTADPLP